MRNQKRLRYGLRSTAFYLTPFQTSIALLSLVQSEVGFAPLEATPLPNVEILQIETLTVGLGGQLL